MLRKKLCLHYKGKIDFMSQFNVFSRKIRTSLAKFLFDKKINHPKTNGLNGNEIKSVLFMMHDDRIGDTVISTISFKNIKKKYPKLKILVLCGKNGKEILKYNPNVDEIIEISGKFYKDFLTYIKLGKRKSILCVDFFEFDLRPAHLLALRLIAPTFLIGFYKKKYKIYNLSIEESFLDVHIINRHKAILHFLGIDDVDISYDIFLTDKEKDEVKPFIDKGEGKCKILINPFASSKHRTIKQDKLKNLIDAIKEEIDCCVYILCPAKFYLMVKDIECDKKNVFVFQSKSILCGAGLIKECDIIVSPDTSIVHIASAFNKKTVALYLDFSSRQEKTDIIWGPNNPNAVIINVDTKNGLENDIKNIDNDLIVKEIKKMV
jgi:ADP-heptose:LPS heptosyltransferase